MRGPAVRRGRSARSALRAGLATGLAACLAACAAGGAPASSGLSPAIVEDPPAMSNVPRLDAEQALRRLLALIREQPDPAALDADALRRVFGVDFEAADDGRLGYGEPIAPGWWSAFELDPGHPAGPRFSVEFMPEPPGSHPPATAICAFDAARFGAGLEALGYVRERVYGEHGRVLYDRFARGARRVTVESRGEADDTPERIVHACVRRVAVE